VAALLILAELAYGLVLVRFDVTEEPVEEHFGEAQGNASLELYVQPMAIDAANDSMQVRISVLPVRTDGREPAVVADRDLVLQVHRGGYAEHIHIAANQPLPEVTYGVDLDGGTVRDYPLDVYGAGLHLACIDAATGSVLPIRITAWEGIIGFVVHTRQVASTPEEVQLHFDVRRAGAARFFGVAIYLAMIVMSVCALTIGLLLIFGLRAIDLALVGTMVAIIFTLPALRNTLPGAPPLGVRGDVLVFFWAEIGGVIALGMVVVAWIRKGARPPRGH
jgi:hypothetical protein